MFDELANETGLIQTYLYLPLKYIFSQPPQNNCKKLTYYKKKKMNCSTLAGWQLHYIYIYIYTIITGQISKQIVLNKYFKTNFFMPDMMRST